MGKTNKLQHLRSEIDRIDSDIYNLLLERLEIVAQVGEFKKSQGEGYKTIIRPKRERDMVLSLYRKALDEGFSDKIARGVALIWRDIIALSVNYEENARIALNPSDFVAKSAGENYFGSYSEFLHCESAFEALNRLIENEVTVCVLSKQDFIAVKAGLDKYNLNASEIDKIRVFARLPFFEVEVDGLDEVAVCLAKVPEE